MQQGTTEISSKSCSSSCCPWPTHNCSEVELPCLAATGRESERGVRHKSNVRMVGGEFVFWLRTEIKIHTPINLASKKTGVLLHYIED